MLKLFSSQELLHQVGQDLACIFRRTKRLKFVQKKSLGSQMVTRICIYVCIGNTYNYILPMNHWPERFEPLARTGHPLDHAGDSILFK